MIVRALLQIHSNRSVIISIVNVRESWHVILHDNQRDSHKEVDGRLSDEKRRTEMAMFHRCEADARRKRHEQGCGC